MCCYFISSSRKEEGEFTQGVKRWTPSPKCCYCHMGAEYIGSAQLLVVQILAERCRRHPRRESWLLSSRKLILRPQHPHLAVFGGVLFSDQHFECFAVRQLTLKSWMPTFGGSTWTHQRKRSLVSHRRSDVLMWSSTHQKVLVSLNVWQRGRHAG